MFSTWLFAESSHIVATKLQKENSWYGKAINFLRVYIQYGIIEAAIPKLEVKISNTSSTWEVWMLITNGYGLAVREPLFFASLKTIEFRKVVQRMQL